MGAASQPAAGRNYTQRVKIFTEEETFGTAVVWAAAASHSSSDGLTLCQHEIGDPPNPPPLPSLPLSPPSP